MTKANCLKFCTVIKIIFYPLTQDTINKAFKFRA